APKTAPRALGAELIQPRSALTHHRADQPSATGRQPRTARAALFHARRSTTWILRSGVVRPRGATRIRAATFASTTRAAMVTVRQVRSHRGLPDVDRMGVRRIAGRNVADRYFVGARIRRAIRVGRITAR